MDLLFDRFPTILDFSIEEVVAVGASVAENAGMLAEYREILNQIQGKFFDGTSRTWLKDDHPGTSEDKA